MPTNHLQRILESVPGICSWGILIIPLVASFAYPEYVTIFIVFFSLLWLLRAFGYSFHLIRSFLFYKKQTRESWESILQLIEKNTWDTKLSKQIRKLGKWHTSIPQSPIKPSDIQHIVIVATYKEPQEVLEDTFDSILNAKTNKKNITILLAIEERDKERGESNGSYLQKKYGGFFKDIICSTHPKDIPGEIPGKGGNITYALKEYLSQHPYSIEEEERTIVTTLDADNKVHSDYFSVLSVYFAFAENRQRASYQPIPYMFNNIWNVPLFNRLVAISSTFWHLVESGRPERLHNFSSHAQPLIALKSMNFWSTTSIVEDGHQFWRSYFHFHGDYRVIPTFIPIYQDAVEQPEYFPTLTAQYKQLRRWAYGAEDLSFVLFSWYAKWNHMPFWKTLSNTILLLEGHIMWASAPLVLSIITKGPLFLNPEYLNNPTYYHASQVMGYIFNISFLGIFISMGMTFLLLPPHPTAKTFLERWRFRLSMLFQWILLPPTTIIFAALPALDTQTRLIFGNKLGFNVTEKFRIKSK